MAMASAEPAAAFFAEPRALSAVDLTASPPVAGAAGVLIVSAGGLESVFAPAAAWFAASSGLLVALFPSQELNANNKNDTTSKRAMIGPPSVVKKMKLNEIF